MDQILDGVQHALFDLGAELASRAEDDAAGRIGDRHVMELEAAIDRFEGGLEPLRAFILPGRVPAAAQLHVARCECRTAERRLVQLAAAELVRGEAVRYLNRLSDLLFVLARTVNKANGVADVVWKAKGGRGKAEQ
jgi:cob(I)alamin adenosyltransferase